MAKKKSKSSKSLKKFEKKLIAFEKKAQKQWEKVGPGLVTGASDDDPSGIVTYSYAGAKGGYQFLWTALVTFPLLWNIQNICGKIAIATKKGIAGILKQISHPAVVYIIAFGMFFANTFNIAADLRAISDMLYYTAPLLPKEAWLIISSLAIMCAVVFLSYRKFANVLKYLSVTLGGYILVAFFSHTDWTQAIQRTLIPSFALTKESFLIITAILGTTISPYLFFWESEEEIEELKQRKHGFQKWREIKHMKADNAWGMFFSNAVMFFIILASANVIFATGKSPENIIDVAQALQPLAGNFSTILFTLAVLGTGFLAIPVLAAGAAYILSELFKKPASLDKKINQARFFYIALLSSIFAGTLLSLLPISTIQFLFYTAILFGCIAPFLIFFILLIANNKKIMGSYKNTAVENILGVITLLVMAFTAIAGLLL